MERLELVLLTNIIEPPGWESIRVDPAVAIIAESLVQEGQIEPIVLRMDGSIIAGRKRYAASVILGLTEVWAIYRDVTDDQAATIELAENLHRKHFTPAEMAEQTAQYVRLVEAKLKAEEAEAWGTTPEPKKKRGRPKAAKAKAIEKAAEVTGKSKRTVQRSVEKPKAKGKKNKAPVDTTERDMLLHGFDTFDLVLEKEGEEDDFIAEIRAYEQALSGIAAIERMVSTMDTREPVKEACAESIEALRTQLQAHRPVSLCWKCKGWFYDDCDICLGRRVVGKANMVAAPKKYLERGDKAVCHDADGKLVNFKDMV